MNDLPSPQKAVRFKHILVIWLVIVACIAIGAFIDSRLRPAKPEQICRGIDDQKRRLDSLFTPVQCKGIVRKVEVEPGHDHFHGYTWITVAPIVGEEFVPQPIHTELVDFVSEHEVTIGLVGVKDARIEVGDTFYKAPGSVYFNLFPLANGDSIRSEMDPPFPVVGNDWTYERHGDELCYWRN